MTNTGSFAQPESSSSDKEFNRGVDSDRESIISARQIYPHKPRNQETAQRFASIATHPANKKPSNTGVTASSHGFSQAFRRLRDRFYIYIL